MADNDIKPLGGIWPIRPPAGRPQKTHEEQEEKDSNNKPEGGQKDDDDKSGVDEYV